MTFDEFRASLAAGQEPPGPPLVRALWHDARGNWDTAHRIAQDVPGADAAWVHAYLHRKEGDSGNAAYWYRRAGRTPTDGRLEDEWTALARALLNTSRDGSASA